MEFLWKNFANLWSVLSKKNPTHIATFSTGIIGYIENPITTLIPSNFRSKETNTLIHSRVHTYHPGTIELINVHYQDMKQINSSFEK